MIMLAEESTAATRFSRPILIVEDDEAFGRALRRLLLPRFHRVEVMSGVAPALDRCMRGGIALLLLDRGLPDGDGLAVCRHLRARGLTHPVLVLSGFDGVSDQAAGYDAGVDEYISKTVAPEILCAKIAAHLRRAGGASDWLAVGPIAVHESTGEVLLGGDPVRLTPVEAAILRTLLLCPDRPLDVVQIAEAVHGPGWKYHRGAIYTSISRLRRKLGPAAAPYLVTVPGDGWMLCSRARPRSDAID